MAQLNLGMRFLLELVAIVAVGYSGYQAGSGVTRWILAIGAPIALIVIWAFVVAPGATNPIPQDLRILLGSAILLLAAGLLYAAGPAVPAVAFAALVILNTALLFVLREPAA